MSFHVVSPSFANKEQTVLSSGLDYEQTGLYSQGMATKIQQGSVRERLLAAANELFYEEGVQAVGIERVLERAGVAKASLYSTFGSKDELVRAYLEARHERRRERITQAFARHHTPRARMLAIFDLLAESSAAPGFRGCAFINATAEALGSNVCNVAGESRAWLRSVFLEQARAAGAAEPEQLARDLVLLYDGAMVGAQMDADRDAAANARRVAATLIDSATA